MNLPGCLYCLAYPSQRSLLSLLSHRRLFPDPLPLRYPHVGGASEYGTCVSGWDEGACAEVLAAVNAGNRNSAVHPSTLILVLLVLAVLLLR